MSTITEREKKKYVQAQEKSLLLQAAIRQVREQLFGLAVMLDAQRAIVRAYLKKIVVILIIFAFGYLSGCCKVLRGTGYLVEAVGDTTVAVGQHLVESGEEKE